MARPQGRCIFCGGATLTKEHVFPKWARKLLHATAVHTQMKVATSYSPVMNLMFFTPDIKQKQGEVPNKRLRVVCKSCNTGWMSEVESQVKPTLTRLILNEKFAVGAKEQGDLAFWVGLRAAVFERDDPDHAALTEEEYRYIFDSRKLPEYWRVFIAGNEASEWKTRMQHYGGEVVPEGFASAKRKNVQRTIIGMQSVVLCALSSTSVARDYVIEQLSPKDMVQIHPFKEPINWPPTIALGNDAIDKYAYGVPLRL